MRWVRRSAGVALVVAVLVGGWLFAAANDEPVRVDFLWLDAQGPLWQAVITSFAVGFALAGAIGLWFGLRAKLVQRRYRKALGGLESEVHELRNLPLSPDSDAAGATARGDAVQRAGEREAGGRGA